MKNCGKRFFGHFFLPPKHGNTKNHQIVCEILCIGDLVAIKSVSLTTKFSKSCAKGAKGGADDILKFDTFGSIMIIKTS